jgi:hypothetical protein
VQHGQYLRRFALKLLSETGAIEDLGGRSAHIVTGKDVGGQRSLNLLRIEVSHTNGRGTSSRHED